MPDLWVSKTTREIDPGKSKQQPRRQRSWEVDVQRARALRGDALEELTESQREWVWRSLLHGVRLSQATKLAQLAPEETPQALQQVANRYSALMDQRRRERQAQRITALSGNAPQTRQLDPESRDRRSGQVESRGGPGEEAP
jgi:hypothetical protein